MKFKPSRRFKEQQVKVTKRAEKKQSTICLGDFCDDYPDMIDPVEVRVSDDTSIKITIKRGGDFGLPQLEVREWKDTAKFSGYTKRGIAVPCSVLEEFSDAVVKMFDLVEERGYDHE